MKKTNENRQLHTCYDLMENLMIMLFDIVCLCLYLNINLSIDNNTYQAECIQQCKNLILYMLLISNATGAVLEFNIIHLNNTQKNSNKTQIKLGKRAFPLSKNENFNKVCVCLEKITSSKPKVLDFYEPFKRSLYEFL